MQHGWSRKTPHQTYWALQNQLTNSKFSVSWVLVHPGLVILRKSKYTCTLLVTLLCKFSWQCGKSLRCDQSCNLPNSPFTLNESSQQILSTWSVIFPVGNSDHDTYVDDAATLEFAVVWKKWPKKNEATLKIMMGGIKNEVLQ